MWAKFRNRVRVRVMVRVRVPRKLLGKGHGFIGDPITLIFTDLCDKSALGLSLGAG